jgi:hypothetical protein
MSNFYLYFLGSQISLNLQLSSLLQKIDISILKKIDILISKKKISIISTISNYANERM